MKIHYLISLLAATSLHLASSAQAEDSKITPQLRKIMDATKWKYSVNKYGQPVLDVKIKNGGTQQVYLHNRTYTYGKTDYYFVVSTFFLGNEKPDEAIFQAAMIKNAYRFATISLMDSELPDYKGEDRKYDDEGMSSGSFRWGMRASLTCCTGSGSEGLKDVISQVAEDAYDFKMEHFAKPDDEIIAEYKAIQQRHSDFLHRLEKDGIFKNKAEFDKDFLDFEKFANDSLKLLSKYEDKTPNEIYLDLTTKNSDAAHALNAVRSPEEMEDYVREKKGGNAAENSNVLKLQYYVKIAEALGRE